MWSIGHAQQIDYQQSSMEVMMSLTARTRFFSCMSWYSRQNVGGSNLTAYRVGLAMVGTKTGADGRSGGIFGSMWDLSVFLELDITT